MEERCRITSRFSRVHPVTLSPSDRIHFPRIRRHGHFRRERASRPFSLRYIAPRHANDSRSTLSYHRNYIISRINLPLFPSAVLSRYSISFRSRVLNAFFRDRASIRCTPACNVRLSLPVFTAHFRVFITRVIPQLRGISYASKNA